ncbi:MAG: hypothetical protein IJ157_01080 [Clostridia bacterium]|nr:hypothetical protein [Clostridia bacterium]
MDAIFPLLLIIISFAISASKKKQKRIAGKGVPSAARTVRKKAHKPYAESKTPLTPAQPAPKETAESDIFGDVLPFEDFERDGSIEMPAIEPHEHEGKPMPCPAEEREMPRQRPSQQAAMPVMVRKQGLQLNFAPDSVTQAVVMAEILKRPAFKNGRRVIR